jgi:hypothetical protein
MSLLFFGSLAAADWEEGNQAMANADYPTAVEIWKGLLEEGVVNEDIYYNLGYALYRQKNYSGAVLAWERAQLLSPRDPDIQANLAFTRRQLQDDLPLPIGSWFSPWEGLLSANEASWLGAFLLGSALFVVGARQFQSLPPLEAPAIAAGLMGGLLLVGSAFQQKDGCVVLAPELKATSDLSGGVELFTLHAGAIVRCSAESSGRLLVELPDDRKGWVPATALGRIDPMLPFPKLP